MNGVLKGNYKLDKNVQSKMEMENENLEEEFEKEALRNLGGSICYVSKKKVNWDIKKDFED